MLELWNRNLATSWKNFRPLRKRHINISTRCTKSACATQMICVGPRILLGHLNRRIIDDKCIVFVKKLTTIVYMNSLQGSRQHWPCSPLWRMIAQLTTSSTIFCCDISAFIYRHQHVSLVEYFSFRAPNCLLWRSSMTDLLNEGEKRQHDDLNTTPSGVMDNSSHLTK